MIICICKNVNEKTIRKEFKEKKSLAQVVASTKAGLDCSKCLRYIKNIRDEEIKNG